MFRGLCAVLLVAFAAHAQTPVRFQDGASPAPSYTGTRDVSLPLMASVDQHWDPNVTYNGSTLEVDGSPSRKVALLRFDLSSLPQGDPVISASLRFRCVGSTIEEIELFRVLAPWKEAEVTWNRRSVGVPWGLPGAQQEGTDFAAGDVGSLLATALGTISVSLPPSLVQSWVDSPSTNFGVLLRGPHMADGADFSSCSATTVADRPQLVVVRSSMSMTIFQNGSQPSASYAGCTDATIAFGPDPQGNANGAALRIQGGMDTVVLLFDVSALPYGTIVQSGALDLLVVSRRKPGPLEVYGVIPGWNEETADWSTRDGKLPWAVPGANGVGTDHDAALSALIDVAREGPVTTPLTDAGVAWVQSWVDGRRPNNGWVLTHPDAGPLVVLASREDVFVSRRPALSLTVTLPPGPDAGAGDAGHGPQPRALQVGCGCGSTGAGWVWVWPLLLWVGGRRPRIINASIYS